MPTRDPDDGEIDNVQEFIDSLGEVEYDDVLLSLLGDGGNLDVPGDVVEQQLANALSSWRDDGDREPVRDEAIGQKHPQGGEWPPGTTGGTVSVQDDAAQLRAIPLPRGEIREATAVLTTALQQVSSILGPNGTGAQELAAAIQETRARLDGAFEMVEEIGNVLDVVAGRLTQG